MEPYITIIPHSRAPAEWAVDNYSACVMLLGALSKMSHSLFSYHTIPVVKTASMEQSVKGTSLSVATTLYVLFSKIFMVNLQQNLVV